MCGIFCTFSECQPGVTEELSKTFQEFNLTISRRGPDHTKIEVCHIENNIFIFGASVLWLQGPKITKQPVQNDSVAFVYNGDIFDDINSADRKTIGDTKLFLEYLESPKNLTENLFRRNGPFAFIYLDKINSKLYFGRDKYGRRSLLIGKNNGNIILSSVAKRNKKYRFVELPSLGIFSYDLKTRQVVLSPWSFKNRNFKSKLDELEQFLGYNITVENCCEITQFKEFTEPTEEDVRVCVIMKHLGCGNPLDVMFSNDNWSQNVETLKELLKNAINNRISTQPNFCQACVKDQISCDHSITGVLFSGGVDCAILALLANDYVDKNRPIDLLNVAFGKGDYNTPDRKTGYDTLKELRKLCPEREWNFEEVNVPEEELDVERANHVADLIHPLKTILDDSLGCALWFASRGKSSAYVSPCRVLLVGMGADELFGGYSRHRAAFKKGGWQGLNDVLIEDWENLPYRNLARDDRVVADHGRQLRTPYLDEKVVQFVQGLNVWEKAYPSEDFPSANGDKLLLRCLAHNLGLKNAAWLKKRALQFGSRIANSKENAHDVSPRL